MKNWTVRISASIMVGAIGLVAVSIVSLGVLLMSVGTARAAWPGKNGVIAFVRNSNIWLMNPDGTNQHRIALNGGSPRWSPDGKRITFKRGPNIWVMNANGSNQLQVTKIANNFMPSFSPDGQYILYQSDRGHVGSGDFGIYELRSTPPFGSVITVIPSVDFVDSLGPVYAANGLFSYLRDDDNTSSGNCCGILIRPGGIGGAESSLAFTHAIGKIDWGPGSKTLAYGNAMYDQQIDDYTSSQINTINRDGTGHRILKRPGTLAGYFDENPSWAPAGTWIVFDEYYQNAAQSRGIWKMRGDGSGRVRIATAGSEPDWQPLP